MNKKVNDNQVETLTVNVSFDGVSSFTTDVLLNETYTIKELSQESNTITDSPESETLMNELALDYRLSIKRLRRHLKRLHQ